MKEGGMTRVPHTTTLARALCLVALLLLPPVLLPSGAGAQEPSAGAAQSLAQNSAQYT
jgi:hypothetical protein